MRRDPTKPTSVYLFEDLTEEILVLKRTTKMLTPNTNCENFTHAHFIVFCGILCVCALEMKVIALYLCVNTHTHTPLSTGTHTNKLSKIFLKKKSLLLRIEHFNKFD